MWISKMKGQVLEAPSWKLNNCALCYAYDEFIENMNHLLEIIRIFIEFLYQE